MHTRWFNQRPHTCWLWKLFHSDMRYHGNPCDQTWLEKKRFGGQSTLSAGSPCTHSVLQWKKQDNNDYGWYSFSNSSLSLHVCGCQVSAIEVCNIQNMTLARSHWLPEVSHQRQPDQNIIDIKGLCSGQGHSISIRSSEIIVMTPHNRGFFRPLFFLFATSL